MSVISGYTIVPAPLSLSRTAEASFHPRPNLLRPPLPPAPLKQAASVYNLHCVQRRVNDSFKGFASLVLACLSLRPAVLVLSAACLSLSACYPPPPCGSNRSFQMSSQNGLKREAQPFETPPSGKPTKIRRALAACKNCRKQKTRCDHSGGAPCHRCKVLG